MTKACENVIILANIIGADKMKKSCVFLFVMSIISLLLAVFAVIKIIYFYSTYKEYNDMFGDDAWFIKGIMLENIFLSAIASVAEVILGVTGVIGSIKRGRFTAVCICLGILLVLCGFFGYLYSAFYTGTVDVYGLGLICSVLYTVAAFKSRKAA